MNADFVISDIEYVVCCDGSNTILEKGAVAIKGSKIVWVGSSIDIKDTFAPGVSIISLPGHILMPGLVNSHTHVPMSIFRGLADDMILQKWLNEVIFPAEAKLINRESVYAGALLSIAEMLLGGTTTFCDGYFYEEEVARAAADAGMRAVVGQGVLDYPTPDNPEPERWMKRISDFIEGFPSSEIVRPAVFCHAPYTCSPDTIRKAHEFCVKNDLIFQIHLAETIQEIREVEKRYGLTPGRYLNDLGVLGEKTVCIHGVWLERKEIQLIAEQHAKLVHCPESNMKLASGVADLPMWLQHRVVCGLGTDGPASNNNLDMFGEMRMAALLHKGIRQDPTVCSAIEVLRMATLGGAKVLGLSDIAGSIEVGKSADLIALDVTVSHATPLYDPVSHIVYSAKASDVRHVWVAGRQVVRNGELTTVDLSNVLETIKKLFASKN
ncbi:MAG: amidohydrolase [Deltaproteobacteria bacterium]|nr:amidohydrolase [Deltaproteobacteria bacterium]MBW2068867.1 amidohydrolase [Deltaproteobacteria bacterium]